MQGMERLEARALVREKIAGVLEKWEREERPTDGGEGSSASIA
jgi:hypothetical protein